MSFRVRPLHRQRPSVPGSRSIVVGAATSRGSGSGRISAAIAEASTAVVAEMTLVRAKRTASGNRAEMRVARLDRPSTSAGEASRPRRGWCSTTSSRSSPYAAASVREPARAQHARVVVELDGQPQPRRHPPDQRIPRHHRDGEDGDAHQPLIVCAHVFAFVSQNQVERRGVEPERPAWQHDARRQESDDGGARCRGEQGRLTGDDGLAPLTSLPGQRHGADEHEGGEHRAAGDPEARQQRIELGSRGGEGIDARGAATAFVDSVAPTARVTPNDAAPVSGASVERHGAAAVSPRLAVSAATQIQRRGRRPSVAARSTRASTVANSAPRTSA